MMRRYITDQKLKTEDQGLFSSYLTMKVLRSFSFKKQSTEFLYLLLNSKLKQVLMA
jgi:hypothetical protein